MKFYIYVVYILNFFNFFAKSVDNQVYICYNVITSNEKAPIENKLNLYIDNLVKVWYNEITTKKKTFIILNDNLVNIMFFENLIYTALCI